MPDSGTRTSASEILVHLDRSAPGSLHAQLEQALRRLIRSGALSAGTILPSSRVLAADLGVSRRTVVEAYRQLGAEGYLSSTQRSVTRVGHADESQAYRAVSEPAPARYDLRPGVPALAEFPRVAWLKATTASVRAVPDAALAYPDPLGSPALREAVAAYLRRVRAVATDPDRVVICAGFTQALALLTQALGRPLIALENPGVFGRDRIVTTAGGRCRNVPVDASGLRVDRLADPDDPDVSTDVSTDVSAVVTAPAHQFPLGVPLSTQRRNQLLSWAREDRVIIEDDYDAEFRYDRRPVGALQGLAPDRVAYVGTVSKTLAPALRLGWLVLPARLVDAVVHAKQHADAGSPILDQLTLAELIDSGAYDRHLRRVRRIYRQRRDQLLAAFARHLPSATISGAAAGMHLVAHLPARYHPTELVTTARRHGLAITGLDRYLLPGPHHTTDSLVIGYGNITHTAIDTAIRQLAVTLRTLDREGPEISDR